MSKETLVLLPGMMCDERLFAPQIEAFSNDYQIVVPSLVQPSIEAMAEIVLEDIEANTFNLAGLSMGGIVAMEIVRQAPERINRLALLDTTHLADPTNRYELRNRQIEDVDSGKLRDVIVEEMKPIYLAEKNRHNHALLDTLIDMALDVGLEAFVAQSIALRDRNDATSALKTFQKPSLVMCGEEDKLCPPQRHQDIANLLKHSNYKTLPNTGHVSTLESPKAVNWALMNWIQR